jgi:hypothetical protein
MVNGVRKRRKVHSPKSVKPPKSTPSRKKGSYKNVLIYGGAALERSNQAHLLKKAFLNEILPLERLSKKIPDRREKY